MSQDPRRRSNRNPTKRQERDLAGTVVQDLWNRCHPLPRMSERKVVYDSAAASLSMSQPLAVEINPMNHATTNGPASCENDILFRHGPLLPKLTNPRSPRPLVNLFAKILAPLTNPYRYKRANKAPYPSASR